MTKSILFVEGFISADVADNIGRLKIDRPDRKNAINAAMWQAIPEACEWLAAEGARVIILSGGG